MMGKREIPLGNGDEHDALTKCRKWYHWKPGQIRSIKRRFNKRARQATKNNWPMPGAMLVELAGYELASDPTGDGIMKRVLTAAAIFVLLMFTNAFGVMTCVETEAENEQEEHYLIVLECTFDTTPATAVDTIPTATMALMQRSRYIYTFATRPGTTGPTDNSDLQILDSNGKNILSATGNGANVIDNATVTSVIYGDGPTAGSTNHYPKPHQVRPWTITVTNNAVNSSSFFLEMECSP